MADEPINPEQPLEPTSQSAFDAMSEITPPRPIPDDELPEKEETERLGITATQNSTAKLSDMQTADLRLHPPLDAKWLEPIRVSCILPEAYIPFKNLLLLCVLEEYPDMSFGQAVVEVEHAVSVGLDREGIFDELALAGAARNAENADKANKNLLGL